MYVFPFKNLWAIVPVHHVIFYWSTWNVHVVKSLRTSRTLGCVNLLHTNMPIIWQFYFLRTAAETSLSLDGCLLVTSDA